MVRMEFKLADGKTLVNDSCDISRIVGLEELLPSIEQLKEKDSNYKFRVKNTVIEVKARDIVSVNLVFV
ncbi:hypothetical protein FDA33_00975 [Clostridium botulinum]|nr:hypothetical protein [Clostridium botulinum]NFI16757.1 hypothetical protein [Clostridium botulinum]NFL94298.1 hypothetical protein [Clostridium botulinum]NFN50321.1 hypothetical protein [Clostridium botulinum]NFO25923.1 hypothetical protein [Clostridium botulinum]